MLACVAEKENMVRILINSGSDLNLQNRNGNTALILACYIPNIKIISILLDTENIDLNIKNIYGETALIYSCYNSRQDIILMLLNKKDINLNIRGKDNNTLLMCLLVNRNIDDVEKLNLIKLLIDKGIDINIREYNNDSHFLGLICTVQNSDIFKENAIKLLLDTNINLTTVDHINKSGFEYICTYSSEETIKDCFTKHIYYSEAILKSCIKITPYKKIVIDVLEKLYTNKINHFNAY